MNQYSFRHYCPDWDYLFIDETYPEFQSCLCYGRNKDGQTYKDSVQPSILGSTVSSSVSRSQEKQETSEADVLQEDTSVSDITEAFGTREST